MEGNGLRGGIFSNLSPGILGLEMPIQQQPPPPPQPQPPQQRPQNPHHFHPQMVAFARPETDHSSQMKQPGYPYAANPRQLSDDEEGGTEENAADGKRKGSPWQRMKWTDGMVRLLIMAVYYIGDECGSEGGGEAGAGKKKAGALMQKKGKWKSVSRAMMEKGFHVSPQQCEDKFNDLNKRYKRVNEILGKGTACKVVENQSLLDQMDHLTPKSKEEARKLLNSKHLFFREMCAYHNSCGGGAGHHSPEQALAPRNSSETLQIHHSNNSHNHSEGEGDDEDSENEEDDDSQNEEEEGEVRCSTKRRIEGEAGLRGLEGEVGAVMSDGGRSGWEKREWLKRRMVRVEEERVGQEMEAFEIEKERLKWAKYSSKKEREMERKRLRNERAKLENDRMVLLLKHKELQIMSHFSQQQQQQMGACNNKRADPSSVTG
uniref:Myb/SANT-like DNA-binding domain-containing protein n=1 Tax=Kalanchoe fedtschenkoi TaxID=63787 RepID=A0A7N0V4Z3_KALFE